MLSIGLGITSITRSGIVSNFNPANISGLQLWLDASDAATITQAAGLVSQWNDKSGNGNHATQGTGANQPTTGTRTIGGGNAIAFDGVDDQLELPSALYSITTGDSTLFVVFAKDDTRALARPFAGSNGGNRYGVYGDNAFTGVSFISGANGAQPFDLWTQNTNPHTFVGYRNGTTLYSNMVTAVAGSASNSGATNFTLTGLTVGNNTSFFGIIRLALLYNRALSTSEINQIGNYINTETGVTWTNI